MSAGYRFELSGISLPDDDLFGVWQTPAAAGLSFAGQSEAAPDVPVWRVSLPDEPVEAQLLLTARLAALHRSQKDLEEAGQALSGIGPGLSYAAVSGPEAELREALSAIEAPVSFAPAWVEASKLRETMERWRAFMKQVDQLVSHFARVETEIAGQVVGHTAVGWTGDFDTHWAPEAGPSALALHRQTVHLALASRVALLRLLIVVGTGAARLALRLSVPGAQLLVLPAAWKFVSDVLKELRRSWPQISSSI